MRFLVTGASGFIGSAVVAALRERGHTVVAASRHPPAGASHALQVDFASVPSAQWWQARLVGIDAVVNAVGIIREQGGQTFEALHTDAPIELFRGCVAAGVPRVFQISALGADQGARSRYHASKRAADDALRALPLVASVIQPSMVYGDQGGSALLFDRLAVAPLLPLPAGGRMRVQPLQRDDLVAGLLALIERLPRRSGTYAFAGPEALTLRAYLGRLRAVLGEPGPLRVVPVPAALFRLTATLAGKAPGALLDRETAEMLMAGNVAATNDLPSLLGRQPSPVEAFRAPDEAEGARLAASVALWQPLLRLAVAAMWLWTGIVSLGLYPVQDSLALLARVGLTGLPALLALYGAAGLDIVLGLLTVAAPARWRRPVWLAQLALMAAYTVLISAFLPEQWLHPYGPLSKNLPLAAAIALLWALEPRPSKRRS